MASLANRFQDLELCLKSRHGQAVKYGRALRDAIVHKDDFTEVEMLKSLGDLHLQKGKRSKDSAEFDKTAALYSAALLRCTDPDMGQTLEHRINYMEKLSRQLLQGYSPRYRWLSPMSLLSPSSKGTADNNILRVAEICHKVDKRVGKPWHSIEEIYMETLVTAVENGDMLLELEVLKTLGDLYLENGKKKFDLSQFPKAATMYNKALARREGPEGPETRQTLYHRISYMGKIWEGVKRNYSKRSEGLTEEDRQRHRRYKHHFKEGKSFLDSADLDSAEQHFAAALQAVHTRDPTAQQYQREVEPLCKLGDVYSKRGQQTGEGGDFVKAAALYSAAIARSEDKVTNGNIAIAIKEVEKSFLKCILAICHNVSRDDTERHKKQLKEMRDQIKLEMETIDQHLDPYVHDEDDPCVKEIEANRAQAIRQLFENITQQRKEFISLLVEECIGLMGPPPCKYALIGLGSQATGLVTPYSDLEFAILVEDDGDQCLEYFRNLTHYLHLKVVNLGETILPALAITSLNDFHSKNPLDNWYYDSVTPRGFAFDGSMPKASKTPLGRQGTTDQPTSELICTPENMVLKLKDDATLFLKEGYHLATILRNPSFIAGHQELIDTYIGITENVLQADRGMMYGELCRYKLAIGYFEEALTKDGNSTAEKLQLLNSIAGVSLRLGDYRKSINYCEQIIQIEESICGQGTADPYIAVSLEYLGIAWMELGEVRKAIIYFEQALQTARSIYGDNASTPYIAKSLNNLGIAWHKFQDYGKAIGYYEKSLQMRKSIYGQSTVHADIANSLNSLGGVWGALGDHRKAISYCEQALQMCTFIYGHNTTHPHIAILLNNLGETWYGMGDYRKATSYHEQALQMHKSVYGRNTVHPDIASALNSLGGALDSQGDHKTAVRYYDNAIQMLKTIYGEDAVHPHIAYSLSNLGQTWTHLADDKRAIGYFEDALQMFRSIHGKNAVHDDIAGTLGHLGHAWSGFTRDHRKASTSIRYCEEALQMYRSIYGPKAACAPVAYSLSMLGLAWFYQLDVRKAIHYIEKALQIYREIHGQAETVHTLRFQGLLWLLLKDYKKASIKSHQALALARKIDLQDKDAWMNQTQRKPNPSSVSRLPSREEWQINNGTTEKYSTY
ncbi:KLC1 [Branchiostoma lanceolatum]|uniref:KLC1 protein n=1 Tax=Branchiostoma lanceolatum TaxID=7740 RepID=A0A8J9VHJ7_BRALA|nr:KLC1 [Branchiostoma lanceolatum]